MTKLRHEFREQYIEAHRNVSEEVLKRYRAAGMRHCSVYLFGDDLVLIVDAEDHTRLAAILADDPVDRAWQDFVRPMKADGDWQEAAEIFSADL